MTRIKARPLRSTTSSYLSVSSLTTTSSYKVFIAALTMLVFTTTIASSHPVNSSIQGGLVLDLRLRNRGGGGRPSSCSSSSSSRWWWSSLYKQGATTATKSSSQKRNSSSNNIDRLVSELKFKYKQLKKENEEKNPLSYNHIIDHMLDHIYTSADSNVCIN